MSSLPARVILLAGPSGSGKTTLAARSGVPVLGLDHFYKDQDDPTLPRLPGGAGDWDAPASWNADAAVAAIVALCTRGAADTPVYDIATSSATGVTRLDLDGSPVFVAEGIFAAEIVGRVRELGLAADAICLRGRPSTTAWHRFVRDIREGRKSVPFLLRRGWHLYRTERAIVARQLELGCTPCDFTDALARVLATGTVTAAQAA